MTEDRYDPNTLADRLDALLPPGRFDTPLGDDDPLVDIAIQQASLPQPPRMSAEAKTHIRTQVLDAYRQQMRPTTPRLHIPSALRWAMVASVVLALFTGVVLTPVTLASVPGDALYPLKQSIEQAELAFATSPQAEAYVHLEHAERRAQEALDLLERGQWAPDLVQATLNEMVTAAVAARSDTTIPTSLLSQLEERTVQVNLLLTSTLLEAEQSGLVSEAVLAPLTASIQATQASGLLLLPPTVTPTPVLAITLTTVPAPFVTPTSPATPVVTATPNATETPTVTQASTSTPELTSEVTTESPTDSSEVEQPDTPVIIVIDGPVDSINVNVITIYGLEIELDPDDPLLVNLKIGDLVHLEGEMQNGVIVIVVVNIIIVDADMEIPGGGGGGSGSGGSGSGMGDDGMGDEGMCC